MKTQTNFLAAAVLASALATVGCDAKMLTQANDALKTVRTAGSAVGNVRIPTAAVASALGGIELVNALAKDGAQQKASGNIIAAGSGNIIAAGSGNIIAAGSGNYDLAAVLDTFEGKPPVQKVDQNGVKANLWYTSTLSADKFEYESKVQMFSGNTNGYEIEIADAVNTYFISSNGKGGRVDFKLGKPATLKKAGDKPFTATISKLEFTCQDPMPQDYGYIGGFELQADDDGKTTTMSAELGIKGGKIQVYATISTPKADGTFDKKDVRFGQDNPSFTEEELDAAQKAQREADDKARAEARAAAKAEREEERKKREAAATAST